MQRHPLDLLRYRWAVRDLPEPSLRDAQVADLDRRVRAYRAWTADDVSVLGPTDVAEMRALAALTDPGPFSARTAETGTYLGIRKEGSRPMVSAK